MAREVASAEDQQISACTPDVVPDVILTPFVDLSRAVDNR